RTGSRVEHSVVHFRIRQTFEENWSTGRRPQRPLDKVRPREESSSCVHQQLDTNRPFQLHKRSQLFIGTHNVTLTVAAMSKTLNKTLSELKDSRRRYWSLRY